MLVIYPRQTLSNGEQTGTSMRGTYQEAWRDSITVVAQNYLSPLILASLRT